MHSFRAEAYGGYSITRWLADVCRTYAIPRKTQWTFHSDNQGLIQRASDPHHPSYCNPLYTDADITNPWRSLLDRLTPITLVHVKGHQDTQGKELTLAEELNVRADELATQALATWQRPQEKPPFLPECPAYILHQGIAITSEFEDTLRRAIYSQDLRQYLERKHLWTTNQCDDVAWSPFHKALRTLRSPDQQRIHKYLYPSWLPTNGQQHRLNNHVDHRCPRCFEAQETALHVIQCHEPGAVKLRVEWRQQLDAWLKEQHTAPRLSIIIRHALRRVLDGREFPPYSECATRQAFQAQDAIGWTEFFQGYVSTKFQEAQDDYLQTIPVTQFGYSGEIWIKGLISRLWQLFLLSWRHRNDAQHQHDSALSRDKQRALLLARVNRCYQQQPLMLSHHQFLFDVPWEERRHHDAQDLLHWLANVESLAATSIQAQQEITRTQHHPLTHYFPNAPQTQLTAEGEATTPPFQ